jgi:hypothetical protein
MSSFVALHGIRRYLRDHPYVEAKEAVRSLRRSDSDFAAANFEVALRLHEQFPEDVDFVNPTISLRKGLALLIEIHQPWWSRFFPHGRQRLATALTQDELQTFRSAGLFDEAPSHEIVQWWDRFADLIRAGNNERLGAQGRYAEGLTIEYERKRLASLGITNEPRWTALEDNSAGYDVQSFETTAFGLKNQLIEVKSSTRSLPRMILTRGEWDVALQYGESYVFHLWKLPEEELLVLRVADVERHIPNDHGRGRWTEVEISF